MSNLSAFRAEVSAAKRHARQQGHDLTRFEVQHEAESCMDCGHRGWSHCRNCGVEIFIQSDSYGVKQTYPAAFIARCIPPEAHNG